MLGEGEIFFFGLLLCLVLFVVLGILWNAGYLGTI